MPLCKLDYGDLFYEERGTGLPVIFLHPPGMGRRVFHFQKPLREKFRIILPDLSGHGDSTARMNQITIQGYAQEVLHLIDHLGIERITLCGYSSGGSVAQEFTLNYPDRAAGLILSGGFAKVESPALKYEHLMGMYFVKHAPETLAKVIATAHTFDKGYRHELITHMLKAEQRTWFNFYEQSLNYSCLDRLKSLTVPLLLIYGARDFINQHYRAYGREVKQFQTAIIQKVSHQVPVKKWLDFNREIARFMDLHVT